MEFGAHEPGDSGPSGSVQLIDLTEEEPEAPFAVREADSTPLGRASKPTALDVWSWFGDHPVVLGVATGVICFAIIATAISLTIGSGSDSSDDPVAGAAISEMDGGRGSFAGDSSNFTSDDPKRTGNVGAPKALVGTAGENDSTQSTIPAAPSVGDQALDVDGKATSGDGQGSLTNDSSTNTDTATTGNGTGVTSGATSGATSSTQRTASTQRTTSSRNSTPTTRATSTTAGVASTQSATPTTRSTTTTTRATTTTVSTTTTSTTTPPVNVPLIAAPSEFSAHSIQTPVNFNANVIPGATTYCWRFAQAGRSYGPYCPSGTSYQLSANSLGLAPGTVTVTATATGPSVDKTQTITIVLVRPSIFAQPWDGASVTIGRAFPVRIAALVGASEYLLRFMQGGYDSGWISYGSDNGTTIMRNDAFWDNVGPGRMTIQGVAQNSRGVLDSGTVTVTLVD